jgi:hypothetical protein
MRYVSKSNLIFLLAVTIFLFHSGYLYNFTVDDAYISFRYADNLAQGKGIVYNVGERQEGYSNFLWIILLAIFSWLGISPVIASKFLSIIFGVGICILTLKLSQLFEKENVFLNFAAVLLLVVNNSFALWTVSGMETAFYTFLLLLACYLFLRDTDSKKIYVSAFCFLLVALTRPEGIIFFSLPVLFIIYDLFISHAEFRRKFFIIYLLILAIPFSVYLVWKFLYFGTIIPNPFYAKFQAPLRLDYQPGIPKLRMAFHYITQALQQHNLLVTIPFLGILFGMKKEGREKLIFMGCVILLQFFFIFSVGGDWMPSYRFVVPVLPFIYLLFQEGISTSLVWLRNRCFNLCLFVTILGMCLANFPPSKADHYEYSKSKEGAVKRISEFGVWLQRSFPSHYTVAYTEAGIPMYYSNLRLLDVLGLISRDIAKIWYTCPDDYWELNRRVVNYVLEKKPELIILVFKQTPKQLRDFKGGVDYTFYHNIHFQTDYELTKVKDWYLPGESPQWPEGVSMFVYLRKDLKSFYQRLL